MLKSNATSDIIDNALSEAASYKETTCKALVQFADVLRIKVGRCGDDHPKESMKNIFTNCLLSRIQSTVRIFKGREQGAHHVETSWYVYTLLEQVSMAAKPLQVALEGIHCNWGRQSSFVATIVNNPSVAPSKFHVANRNHPGKSANTGQNLYTSSQTSRGLCCWVYFVEDHNIDICLL